MKKERVMATFAERIVGAAKLDVRVYEEVEADTSALGQAMAVVVLSSVAAGIGAIGHRGVMGLIGGTVAALIAWFIWAFVTYLIGTKMLPEPQTSSDVGELLRTTGFSSSPGLLRVFGLVPVLGGVVVFVANIWMLVAMIIAVRQALDYNSTWRAIGVCLLGWLLLVIVSAFFLGIVR
jgi:hypothetical protein